MKWAQLEWTKVPVTAKTVGDLLRRYDRDVIPSKGAKTQKDNRKCLVHLFRAFEGAPLEAITPQIIAQYRDARTAPVRANREIALLSHAFNMAREWGIFRKKSPTRGVRQNKEAPRDLQVAMDLAYLTGQRASDVRKMRWSEVTEDFLLVGQGKTAMKLRIRLHIDGLRTGLGRLLDQLDRSRPHLITTAEGKQLTESVLRLRFEPVRKRAATKAQENGDPDLAVAIMQFQFRDIRPKAASEIVSLVDASDLLGHTTQGMTKRVYRRVGKVVNPVK